MTETDLQEPSVTYPDEPWELHGRAHAGVFLVPRRRAPAPHSAHTKPVVIFGRVVVTAAFFIYEEPSPLSYDEIMSTVLVRDGWRPRVSITHIWVNSRASLRGGRELWAIPKEMAEFTTSTGSYVAEGIGDLTLGRSATVPFRLPFGFRIAQDRDGALVTSPVTGRATLGVSGGRWSFDPAGPLGFLAGRRPLLTVSMRRFAMVFGSKR